MQNKIKQTGHKSVLILRGEEHAEWEKNKTAIHIYVSNVSQEPAFTDLIVKNKFKIILSSYNFRKLTRTNLLHND